MKVLKFVWHMMSISFRCLMLVLTSPIWVMWWWWDDVIFEYKNLFGKKTHDEDGFPMDNNQRDIRIANEFSKLLASKTNGVIGVAVGVNNGNPILLVHLDKTANVSYGVIPNDYCGLPVIIRNIELMT